MGRMMAAVLMCGAVCGAVLAQAKPCQPRRHARLPVITELTYHKARKRLLAAGWQPLRTKHYNSAVSDPDIAHGNGRVFWRRGYVEVEACAGTGSAACSFLYRDAYGNRLRVTTEGEEITRPRAYAIVTGYQFECDE